MPKDTQKICAATFRLVAEHGWDKLTLDQIAKAAKIPLPKLKEQLPDTKAVLSALVAHITVETASSIGKIQRSDPQHDRLFEVMMARFDALQKNRQAILNIMKAVRRDDRRAALTLLQAQRMAMKDMLELAGFEEEGLRLQLLSTGLLIIHAAAACVWSRDDTKDMSRTMAALDRLLRKGGTAAGLLLRFT